MDDFRTGTHVHLMVPYGGCSSAERYVIVGFNDDLVTLKRIPIEESDAEQREIAIRRAEVAFEKYVCENLTEN